MDYSPNRSRRKSHERLWAMQLQVKGCVGEREKEKRVLVPKTLGTARLGGEFSGQTAKGGGHTAALL